MGEAADFECSGLVSDSFTWETVETLDFGFDITALNGRLQSTFDWYRRDTKDMLARELSCRQW